MSFSREGLLKIFGGNYRNIIGGAAGFLILAKLIYNYNYPKDKNAEDQNAESSRPIENKPASHRVPIVVNDKKVEPFVAMLFSGTAVSSDRRIDHKDNTHNAIGNKGNSISVSVTTTNNQSAFHANGDQYGVVAPVSSQYSSSTSTIITAQTQIHAASSVSSLHNTYSSVYPALSMTTQSNELASPPPVESDSLERKNYNNELFDDSIFMTCRLDFEIMTDPVMTAYGNTYNRPNIEAWFALGNRTDPLNNLVLPNLELIPNNLIKQLIERHKQQQIVLSSVQNPVISSAHHQTTQSVSLVSEENKSSNQSQFSQLQEEVKSSAGNEVDVQEKIRIFEILKELSAYAFAKGPLAWRKHHQNPARRVLTQLSDNIKYLNRCDGSQKSEEYDRIVNYLRGNLPEKQGGYYKALIAVLAKFEAEYARYANISGPAVPRSRF